MPADLLPPPEAPPEARLITELRERAPRMSMSHAAREAGISPTRWRQIENGYRPERGINYPESGPAQTVARMVMVVGGTPQQLIDAGRPDAAGELEALLAAVEMTPNFTGHQKRGLTEWLERRRDSDESRDADVRGGDS